MNKAYNENPDICKGQPDGTSITSESLEQKYEDEISCSQAQLDCLQADPVCKKCPANLLKSEKTRVHNYQDENNEKLRRRTGRGAY